VRRCLRIFPLYYLGLLVCFFLIPFLERRPAESFSSQWWYWTYLQNVALTFPHLDNAGPWHFWSLAVEEHFYLFWPFVVLLVAPRNLAKVCWALIAAALVTRIVLFSCGGTIFYFTLCRFDTLAVGALIAVWEHSGCLSAYRQRFRWGVAAAAALLIVCFAFKARAAATVQVLQFTVLAGFYGSIVALIRLGTGELTRGMSLLSSPSLRYTGKISYGLYVWHPFLYLPIYRICAEFALPPGMEFVASVSATFFVAWISYELFESRFLRLKDRWTSPTVQWDRGPAQGSPSTGPSPTSLG
jgi:peptidoglycan/LPS O-acetylase OafA/YrhL